MEAVNKFGRCYKPGGSLSDLLLPLSFCRYQLYTVSSEKVKFKFSVQNNLFETTPTKVITRQTNTFD
jgi:hypothetical protein